MPTNPHALPLMKQKKIYFIISITLVVVSSLSWLIQGLVLDIDFTGGTTFYVNLGHSFDVKEVSDIVNDTVGVVPSSVQRSGAGGEEVVIKMRTISSEERTKVFDALAEKYSLTQDALLSAENVSATIGKELQESAIWAATIAVILMLLYITIRFELYSGLAAIITLMQNVIIVIGIYSLFRIPINTTFIAAILTILGYSINDTIVIFDRIRENNKLYKKHNDEELVNVSVTQSFLRSVNTSVTTLFPVVILFAFGVRSIQEFALPLIVGILVGTLSSLFVASPIWATFRELSSKSHKKAAAAGK